jgi:hypothetical protein
MSRTIIIKRGEDNFELMDLTDEQIAIVGFMAFLNAADSPSALFKLAMKISMEEDDSIPGFAMGQLEHMYGTDIVDCVGELMKRISFRGQLSPNYFTAVFEDIGPAHDFQNSGQDPATGVKAEYLAWAEKKEIQVVEDELEEFLKGGDDGGSV